MLKLYEFIEDQDSRVCIFMYCYELEYRVELE